MDTLETSLGYESQTGAGARGRPSAARTMGSSRRSRCRNRGNVCLVLRNPEVESHVSCLPRALRVREIARHLRAGKSLYTQVLASQLYPGVGGDWPHQVTCLRSPGTPRSSYSGLTKN